MKGLCDRREGCFQSHQETKASKKLSVACAGASQQKLQPPPKEWRHCRSARERYDVRAALEAAGLRVASTGNRPPAVWSPYPPVRFSFGDPSGKPPTPIGIEYPDQAAPRRSAVAAAAAASVAPGQQAGQRVSFSFDFPRQPAAMPLVRAC
jgi:hypothetical protein